MRFARWLFLIAGASGLLALLPHYALESWIGREFPPPITHPEFFYGFVGVAAAWQVVFLVIATDPARYRPLMLVGVLEKVSFGGAVLVLFARGRVPAAILGPAAVDLLFGALFLLAYRATARGRLRPDGPAGTDPGPTTRGPGPAVGPRPGQPA